MPSLHRLTECIGQRRRLFCSVTPTVSAARTSLRRVLCARSMAIPSMSTCTKTCLASPCRSSCPSSLNASPTCGSHRRRPVGFYAHCILRATSGVVIGDRGLTEGSRGDSCPLFLLACSWCGTQSQVACYRIGLERASRSLRRQWSASSRPQSIPRSPRALRSAAEGAL